MNLIDFSMQQRLSLALSGASISGFVINVVTDHKTCDEIFPQSSAMPLTNSKQQSIFHKTHQRTYCWQLAYFPLRYSRLSFRNNIYLGKSIFQTFIMI
jgi:hypothetical protein